MSQLLKLSLAAVFMVTLTFCSSAQQSNDPDNSAPAPTASATTTKASAETTMADTKFLKQAAQGGMAEVALGQLAMQNGSSSEVKNFGQRMVNDHSKANDQLRQLASEKHIDLPQHLSAKDKATQESLEKLSGKQFDDTYMKDMVTDHKKDVSDFQRESKTARDPEIKKFASQTLPTLKAHLKQAESIAPMTSASAAAR
jgi:putative membrane protein